jgi:hypothetical protein
MEPLFLAVICGCNAGLFRESLHEIYIPRIQRGDACFASKVLGARGALLAVLIHFFEHGRWASPVEQGVEEQRLTAEDQLFILMEAGIHLTITRGLQAPEQQSCYERAESLCHSLNRPRLLPLALIGQWRYSLLTDELTATMKIANRMHSLAHERDDSALLIKAHLALAGTLYWSGDFGAARQNALRSVQIWRSRGVQSSVEEVDAPAIPCVCYAALCEWHFGAIGSCDATMAEAISLAKDLNDMHGLAVAGWHAGILACLEHNPAEVERLASDLTLPRAFRCLWPPGISKRAEISYKATECHRRGRSCFCSTRSGALPCMSAHNPQAGGVPLSQPASFLIHLPARPSRWRGFDRAVHSFPGRARGDPRLIG